MGCIPWKQVGWDVARWYSMHEALGSIPAPKMKKKKKKKKDLTTTMATSNGIFQCHELNQIARDMFSDPKF
jgi:hypothetical protein